MEIHLRSDIARGQHLLFKGFDNGRSQNTSFNAGGLIYISLLNGNILSCDASFEKLTGYTQHELQQLEAKTLLRKVAKVHLRRLMAIYFPARAYAEKLSRQRCLDDHLFVATVQLEFANKSMHWVAIKVLEYAIVEGKVVGVCLQVSDIQRIVLNASFAAYFYNCRRMRMVKNFAVEIPRQQVKLSAKELCIFRLIKEGYREKEIAFKCNIAITTVKSHKQNVFRRLGVTSSIEALNLMQEYFEEEL